MFQQLLKAIFFPQKFCQMNNFSYSTAKIRIKFQSTKKNFATARKKIRGGNLFLGNFKNYKRFISASTTKTSPSLSTRTLRGSKSHTSYSLLMKRPFSEAFSKPRAAI